MFFLLINTLILLGLILTGCAAPLSLIEVEPKRVTLGRAEVVNIKFDQDIKDTNLSIIPGGPYVKKTTQWEATKVAYNKNLIWSINNTNTVSAQIIKHTAQEIEYIARLNLDSRPEQLAVNNTLLAVTQNKSELLFFDITDPQKIRQTQSLNMHHPIAKLHMNNTFACITNAANEMFYITLKNKTRILAKKKLRHTTLDIIAFSAGCLVIDRVNGLRMFEYNQGNLNLTTVFKSNFISHQALATGNILYVADGNTGLTILEYTHTKKLRWRGSYNKLGNITLIAHEDKRVLTYSDAGILSLFDTTNIDAPLLMSNFRLDVKPLLIRLQKNIAQIYTHKQIIEIDFSIESGPVISNVGVNMGGSRRAYLDDNLLYVADWFSGMHIYDVSQPREPKLLSSLHTTGSPKGVIVREGFAFICDDDHGLKIADVSNPLQPELVAQLPLSGLAYTMDLLGDKLYIAAHRGGFHIVDVKNPRHPRLLGSFDTPGKAWAIQVKNHTAFIADDQSGLLIFDVKNPEAPRQIGQFAPGGFAEDVVIRGNTAFVAFFDAGLYLLDISHEDTPKVLSHLAVPGNSRGISLDHDKLYLASWKAGIHVIDVNNLKKPFIVSHYDTRGFAWGINQQNNIAYVLDWWGGIKLLELSNLHAPRLIGEYQTKGKIHKIAKKNKYLYLANGSRGMQVFDNRNALNPIWVTGVHFQGYAKDIILKGDYAYIAAGDGGLAIAYIGNPFQSHLVNQINMQDEINQLSLSGNTLLLGEKGKTLAVYDISMPATPIFIKKINLRATTILADEHHVFISDATQGIIKLPVKDLNKNDNSHDALVKFNSNEKPEFLAKLNGHLVTASSNHGIALFNLTATQKIPVTFYPISEKISGLSVHEHKIYLSLDNQKLVILSYQQQKLQLETEIISTQPISHLAIANDEIYFAGDNILSTAVLPPSIKITKQNNEARLSIPALMPRGAYHLIVKQKNLPPQQKPNIFSVNLPQKIKSTFTMEDLKKKMQKNTFEGKSP